MAVEAERFVVAGAVPVFAVFGAVAGPVQPAETAFAQIATVAGKHLDQWYT